MARGSWLCVSAVVALACGCTGSNIQWQTNLDTGLAQAARERKIALVQFHSPLCAYCARMDREVFSDRDVQNMVAAVVPIRLNYFSHGQLARRSGVEGTPAFLALRENGRPISKATGFMNVEQFRRFLVNAQLYR